MNPMTLFLIGLDVILGPSRLRLCDIPRGGNTTSIAAGAYYLHGIRLDRNASNEEDAA